MDLICNKDIYIGISLIALFVVLLANFIHASTCLWLWWLYNDDTMYHKLNHLQKFLNFWKKLVPTSETILLGSLYSEKIILYVLLGYLH